MWPGGGFSGITMENIYEELDDVDKIRYVANERFNIDMEIGVIS